MPRDRISTMLLTLPGWLTSTARNFREPLATIRPGDINNRWFVAPSNWWMKMSAQVYGTSIIYLPIPDPRTHCRGLPPELMFISVQFVIQFTRIHRRKWPGKRSAKKKKEARLSSEETLSLLNWGGTFTLECSLLECRGKVKLKFWHYFKFKVFYKKVQQIFESPNFQGNLTFQKWTFC